MAADATRQLQTPQPCSRASASCSCRHYRSGANKAARHTSIILFTLHKLWRIQQRTHHGSHLAPAHAVEPQPAVVLRPAVKLQPACRQPQQLLQGSSSSRWQDGQSVSCPTSTGIDASAVNWCVAPSSCAWLCWCACTALMLQLMPLRSAAPAQGAVLLACRGC
jgi:hypothetical protein